MHSDSSQRGLKMMQMCETAAGCCCYYSCSFELCFVVVVVVESVPVFGLDLNELQH